MQEKKGAYFNRLAAGHFVGKTAGVEITLERTDGKNQLGGFHGIFDVRATE